MTEIVKETRAKSGYIVGERIRKNGTITRTRQHVVVSEGMHSTKEMEKVMRDVARDVGANENRIVIEAYPHGVAPIEANPRHRGRQPSLSRRPDTIREVNPNQNKPAPRRVWGGWSPDS